MTINFPKNPTVGQEFQQGTLPTYVYNGSFWEIVLPGTENDISANQVSLAQTASYTNNLPAEVQYATTASLVTTATKVVDSIDFAQNAYSAVTASKQIAYDTGRLSNIDYDAVITGSIIMPSNTHADLTDSLAMSGSDFKITTRLIGDGSGLTFLNKTTPFTKFVHNTFEDNRPIFPLSTGINNATIPNSYFPSAYNGYYGQRIPVGDTVYIEVGLALDGFVNSNQELTFKLYINHNNAFYLDQELRVSPGTTSFLGSATGNPVRTLKAIHTNNATEDQIIQVVCTQKYQGATQFNPVVDASRSYIFIKQLLKA